MAQLTAEASEAALLLTAEWTTYALAHDDLVGAAHGDLGGGYGPGQQYDIGPDWYAVYRAGLLFDTSAIPASATISAATLSLYGLGQYADTGFNLTIVSGADLNDPLVDADFGDLLDEITSYGALAISAGGGGWAVEDWNVITLNAAGIAAITKAGTTKFGLRSSRDISSTTPKLNGAANNEFVEMYGVLTAGKKPKLTVNYTVAGFCQAFIIG